jgi:hypothetical protein
VERWRSSPPCGELPPAELPDETRVQWAPTRPPDDDAHRPHQRAHARAPRGQQAAAAQHLSVNVASARRAAVDRAETTPSFERSTTRNPNRYRGWAK